MLLPLHLNLQTKPHVYERFVDAAAEMKEMIEREDEEIMAIIFAFMEMES